MSLYVLWQKVWMQSFCFKMTSENTVSPREATAYDKEKSLTCRNQCQELMLFPSLFFFFLLLLHPEVFSEVAQWESPYKDSCKLLVYSSLLMFFCKTYKKKVRERTCYKPPPKPLGCYGLWEGFLQSAKIHAECLGTWKLLLSYDKDFTWSRLCWRHSNLKPVLNQHCQNAPYNQHQWKECSCPIT